MFRIWADRLRKNFHDERRYVKRGPWFVLSWGSINLPLFRLRTLNSIQPNFQNLQVYVSFFEIYCGKLFDLLNNRNELKIMEDKKSNINVIGMEEKYICSAQ